MQDAIEVACVKALESLGLCDSEDNTDATNITENLSENITNKKSQLPTVMVG